jgi:hypothetical protein
VNAHRLRSSIVLLASAFCTPAIAQSVTYEFTGTVTSATGGYSAIPDGSSVTGSYTFDYAAATPGLGSGVIGSPSSWSVISRSGNGFPLPPGAAIFTSTAQVDGFFYSSPSPGLFLNFAEVIGSDTFGVGRFSATEEVLAPPGTALSYGSSMQLVTIPGLPYSSSGLPDVRKFIVPDNGSFQETLPGSPRNSGYSVVTYNLTSLAPVSAVPEPSAWAILAIGLVMMGGVAPRARRAL